MKILLAYIRKSFFDETSDTDRDAVARRRYALEQWAARNGPFRIAWFDDLDISGRYEAGRSGWADLCSHLDDPGVWGVAIEDWRDCHRNVKEFLQFYDNQLAPRGLNIICLNHPNLNPATADGRMLITNLMALNEWESRKSSERRSAAIRYKQTVLGRHFGRVPFGCTRDPATKHLIATSTAYWLNLTTGEAGPLSPGEVAPLGCEQRFYFDALTALFIAFAPGQLSLGDTAGQLNAAGWRNWISDYRTPALFNRFSIYSILKHWYLYAGLLMPYQKPKFGARPIQQAGHAPILPIELCEAVQAALQQRHVIAAHRPHDHAGRKIYPLSGLLFCRICGQRLCGQWTGRYLYYRHTYHKNGCDQKAVLARPLETEVITGLKLLVSQADLFDDIIEELRLILTLAAADDDAGNLARLEQAKTERDRLIDLYTQGLITLAEFTSRRDTLAAEIARLETETASHPARALAETITINSILAHIDRLDDADPLLQKSLLHDLIERLEIQDGQIVAVTPRPWAIPLFEVCRLWGKVESTQQSTQILLPNWLTE